MRLLICHSAARATTDDQQTTSTTTTHTKKRRHPIGCLLFYNSFVRAVNPTG